MILHWIRRELDQALELRELAFDEPDSEGLKSREGSVRHPLGLGVQPGEPEGPNDSEAYTFISFVDAVALPPPNAASNSSRSDAWDHVLRFLSRINVDVTDGGKPP